MKKHFINIRLMVILTTFIFILAGTGPLLAAFFTADMVEIHKDNAKTNKIYLKDHQCRLDVEENGGATEYENKEVERHELLMANGESKTWHFEQNQQIVSIDITMLEGDVQAQVEQPEKPGIILPAWTKTTAAFSIAATSQTIAAPQKSSKTSTPAAMACLRSTFALLHRACLMPTSIQT